MLSSVAIDSEVDGARCVVNIRDLGTEKKPATSRRMASLGVINRVAIFARKGVRRRIRDEPTDCTDVICQGDRSCNVNTDGCLGRYGMEKLTP